MANTYKQLQKQIAALSQEAEKLRSVEKTGAVAKIKELVATYGLQSEDIFGSTSENPSKSRGNARPSKVYSDGDGNTWGGMGKRPQWLREALEAGRSLEEFLGGNAGGKTTARGTASAKRTSPPKRKGAGNAKFGDGANSWSGFGPQPKWLKEAVAAGKSLDDFRL